MALYLRHELVGHRFVVLEADLAGGQRPLQEQPERQLGELGLDERADGLVGEGEDLLALLLPLVVLQTGWRRGYRQTSGQVFQPRAGLTVDEFSLYLKASW